MRRWLAVGMAAAVAATLGAAPSPAAGAATAQPVRVVGGPAHAGLYGWGASPGPDGTVLIGDYWNLRVRQYAEDGRFIRDFINNPGSGPGQHRTPYGLAFDPRDGSVYMGEADNNRVFKYDRTGRLLFTLGVAGRVAAGPGVYKYPSRIAVRSDGWFYVVDTWEPSIVAHTPNGTEQFQFGTFGAGAGQLKQPHGADFDRGDKLFVADSGNARVQVFDTAGRSLRTFGSKGSGPGQFVGDLRGLCIDKARDWVYVVDGAGNRVSKFTTDGQFLLRWGTQGTGPGQFADGGRECAVDGSGNVWVGDMPNFRAQKFSPTGQHLLSIPNPPQPPPNGGFNGPRGVAVGSGGEIFVTDTYNWRIQKFAANGTFAATWGTRGRGPYAFNYARMLATDPRNGDVVVIDTDNHQVKKYTRSGVHLWTLGSGGAGPGQFRNPHGIDVHSDGTIAVADSRNSRVVLVSPAGTFLRSFGTNGGGNGQLKYPRGIAFAPDGTLWVADSLRDDVQHLTATGGHLGTLGAGVLSNPFDVEATASNVVVADTGAHRVRVFTTGGTLQLSFGGLGGALGKLSQPQGLDLVGDRLFVCEQGNERVQEFRLTF